MVPQGVTDGFLFIDPDTKGIYRKFAVVSFLCALDAVSDCFKEIISCSAVKINNSPSSLARS